MNPLTDTFANVSGLWLSLFVHGLFFVVPVLVFSYLAYFFLSLPARRREQSRLFLHVLETCLRDGKPVEPTIVAIAETHDRSPGLRFHLTAAYVEEGDRLATALAKSRLVPRPIIAMLAAGERIGDVRKVLPACRLQLQDARSGVRSALNYFLVLVLGLAPIALSLMWMLLIVVLPRMKEIALGITGDNTPAPWLNFLGLALRTGVWIETLFLGLLGMATLLYLVGPGAPSWLRRAAWPVVDGLAWLVPWKRHRMQRNFAAILAVLLDAGVPEAEALPYAAQCAGNVVFQRRAERVVRQLAAGEALTQAVTALDAAGEFRWRLANAAHAQGGFTNALRGWFEALDARAFQQEQAAAHVFSTALVVLNGATVGCVCAGLFGMITQFIDSAALW
jgi:type II secretory pathway component PulF